MLFNTTIAGYSLEGTMGHRAALLTVLIHRLFPHINTANTIFNIKQLYITKPTHENIAVKHRVAGLVIYSTFVLNN